MPRAVRERFAPAGSQLNRYASRLNGAEINSSFYRAHAFEVYERWSAAVPAGFRFSVKIPKLISHERGLRRAREPLGRFLDESAGLGAKRGPLLLQLPPSFEYDDRRVGRFFDLLRGLYTGPVTCEPRHASWVLEQATRTLARFKVARVAADPPRAPGLDEPAGWGGLIYYRWHGSPRMYFSPYDISTLRALADTISKRKGNAQTWCIFDNTGSGAAAANAMDMNDLINLRDGHSQDRRGVARKTVTRTISGA